DVLHAADLGNEGADAVAQRQHVEQRIGDVAEDRGDGELAPDEEIPPPDRDPAQRQLGGAQQRRGEHAYDGGIEPATVYAAAPGMRPAPDWSIFPGLFRLLGSYSSLACLQPFTGARYDRTDHSRIRCTRASPSRSGLQRH